MTDRTNEIYKTLMKWLEEGSIATPTISIPIDPADIKGPALRFRKVNALGGSLMADSMDDHGVRVTYDPNWEVLAKIDRLIAKVRPADSPALGKVADV
jgi:hypothetical protein